MRIEIFKKKEKEQFNQFIEEKYGFELKGQIIKQSQDKLRIFTGNLSEHELSVLTGTVRVETAGLYLATWDTTNEEKKEESIRLSFDASFLAKNATKNTIDLNDEQVKTWFQGNDIIIDLDESLKTNDKSIPHTSQSLAPNTFILLKYKDEMVGCGKLTSEKDKILNFVPKERRIKNL